MSAAAEVTVVARWMVAAGKLGDVQALLARLREASLREPGCTGYEVYQREGQPRSVLLFEQYRDAAALDAHRQSAHYQSLLVGSILPLLAERQVQVFGLA